MGGRGVAETRELEQALRRRVRGEVRFDPYSRALYSTDASIYLMEPVGVVLPRDLEDVLHTVRTCWEMEVPLLPRGGGTSLAGQGVNRAVVLDFSKYLDRVLEVNEEEGWARVQAGITLEEVNYAVSHLGLKFAPDPTTANRATIGGAIGNNSCGSHSILYGKTLDHILEVEAVLADGTPVRFGPLSPQELEAKTASPGLEGQAYREALRLAGEHREEIGRRYPRILRRVSGYNLDELLKDDINLARLIVGSEGTLAVVAAAKVRLVPRPRFQALAVLHYRTLLEAMEDTTALLGERPATIELVDGVLLGLARGQMDLRRRMGFIQGEPGAVLLVEVLGETEGEARARLEALAQRALGRGLAYACTRVADPKAQREVWAVRRAGVGLLMGVRGDTKAVPFVEDTAVSPERLPEFVRRFDEIVRAHGTTAGYYGHASVGCLHIRPFLNLKTPEGVERLAGIASEIADLVVEFGGSLSGEHGDGIARGFFMERMFGPRLVGAFRDLKKAFDPKGILNPGKVFDTPPLTENLRISPAYRTLGIPTVFDYSREGGFAGLVEQCSGLGACRKVREGTMCPSYMATREEEHSTRGRANALRAVLSGLLPPSEFTSRRLYGVLDLCLECKACKAECPSSVDMAKLKAEFLAHYYRAHGYPLRARLFADIARLNRLGCALAPLSTWLAGTPFARWLQGWLGIHPQRRLPPFARPTFTAWFRRHRRERRDRPAPRGRVVFFHDTFTTYNYPSVGRAAVRLLEAMGYEVVLADLVCCGRPMVSKGMLERARRHARRNIEALYPFVAQGVPIVGCEPSCLLILRDEYPDLLPGEERARAVAENAFLLEEFLARQAEKDEGMGLPFRPFEGKVLFHGHCHQKALAGVEASIRALSLVPGAKVEALDAGCCGMAGSFGFEKEHYEVSMKIGDLRLFPAVRREPEAAVVITGTSCRQQIEHATGRKPLHLAEFLAGQLEKEG